MEENNFGDKGKSEWNEQQAFSKMLFQLSYNCRVAQSQKDILKWKDELIPKISHIMSIAEVNDMGKMYEWKLKLDSLAGLVNSTNPEAKILKAKRMAELANELFIIEAKVDSVANTKIPFLKIKEVMDLNDW